MNKRKARKNKNSKKKTSALVSICANILIAIFFLLLINYLSENVAAYKWLSDKFLKDNLAFIDKYPLLEKKDKLDFKIKMTYRLCHLINTCTPDSAIILFPFDTLQFKQNDFKLKNYIQIKGRVMNRNYVSYFIYPRKLVFMSDIQKKKESIADITHLAIIDGNGYEFLPNKKDTTILNTVYHVNRN